jgi:hypothetical protein
MRYIHPDRRSILASAAPAGAVRVAAAGSGHPDPAVALAEVAQQLDAAIGPAQLYLVFVAVPYPLESLSRALTARWAGRVAACTSAGNLGGGSMYTDRLWVVALAGDPMEVLSIPIGPLDELPARLPKVEIQVRHWRRRTGALNQFGLLMVDGLSRREELLADTLATMLDDIPLVGGSAGDDQELTHTAVFAGDRLVANHAVLTLVALAAPFSLFAVQHYLPGEHALVITDAAPDDRLVRTINGVPAAAALAQALGIPTAELTADLVGSHPLILRSAGEDWVRAVSRVLDDGSLEFFGAIRTGAVLRVGRAHQAAATLRGTFDALSESLGGLSGVLAFDCVLRRLEFERTGQREEIEDVLRDFEVSGFSTYGEQFNGLHLNQTMVGVAFGVGRKE